MNTKIISIAGFVVLVGLLFGFQQKTPAENTQIKKGMIKVTILYPNGDGKKFDMDYYSNKHMPMVARLLGDSLKLFEIDKGIAGRTPEEPVPYLAIGYYTLTSFRPIRILSGQMQKKSEKIFRTIPIYSR